MLPYKKLLAKTDLLKYQSKKCCFDACPENPINSHTISKNYLYKLNGNLTLVLTLQPRLLPIFKNKPRLIKVNKDKFSAFIGFCAKHDAELFEPIDSFDGIINKEKAVLVHYRNISYGINHIKTQILKINHLSREQYVGHGILNIKGKMVEKKHYDNILLRRLNYCLNQHLQRKKQLEFMINTLNFEEINFIHMPGTLNNPVFCGRSSFYLHKNHNLFNNAGYSYMPWLTYMTLLTDTSNTLLFCWLESDKQHVKYFKKLLTVGEFKKGIEVLAYAASDALAVTKDFHKKHYTTINSMLEHLRLY